MVGALKLYMTVFYKFVLIPYTYPYILPLTISLLNLFMFLPKYYGRLQTHDRL